MKIHKRHIVRFIKLYSPLVFVGSMVFIMIAALGLAPYVIAASQLR